MEYFPLAQTLSTDRACSSINASPPEHYSYWVNKSTTAFRSLSMAQSNGVLPSMSVASPDVCVCRRRLVESSRALKRIAASRLNQSHRDG